MSDHFNVSIEEMKKVMDLLGDPEALEEYLFNFLSEDERIELYNHKLLEEFDLFP